MKEQFCSYEIALRLKELGFDGECLAYYLPIEKDYGIFFTLIQKTTYFECEKNSTINNGITAPLWQQVVDWFRNTHKIHIHFCFPNGMKWLIQIHATNGRFLCGDWYYNTYEEAREAAILKAIELIKANKC